MTRARPGPAALASALLCFITIIGIPFGLQHLKLVGASMAPIGKTVVERG